MSAFVFISTHRGIVSQIVGADPDRQHDVTLVVADGKGDETVDGVNVIDIGLVGRGRLSPLFDKSAVTRTLVRLSPADDGARVAKRLRRHERATAAALAAEFVVACDRDSILAAWESTTGSGSAALGLSRLPGGLAALRRAAAH
ncbi:MAG: hypothetical protein Q7J04_08680 [Microcella sp.]|nr:hypothetical protein [Microcella sp.]